MKIKDFTKSDGNFLLLLEEDELLNPSLKRIRRLLNIPILGFNIEDPTISNRLSTLKGKWLILWKEVVNLLSMYDLTLRWGVTFLSLILFDLAVPPDNSMEKDIKPVEIVFDESSEKDNFWVPELKIIIRKKMSKSQLKKFIDSHKNKLNILFSKLPDTPKLESAKNIKRGKLINYWKKQNPKISYEKIADKLTSEFKQNPNFPFEYFEIGGIINRYESLLNKYLKRNLQKRLKLTISLSVKDFAS